MRDTKHLGEGSPNTREQLNTKVTAAALDINNVFETLLSLPTLGKAKIEFLRNRTDNLLVKNSFTGMTGQIRCEFGSDAEMFYIVQYDNGTYGCISEKLALIF